MFVGMVVSLRLASSVQPKEEAIHLEHVASMGYLSWHGQALQMSLHGGNYIRLGRILGLGEESIGGAYVIGREKAASSRSARQLGFLVLPESQ